ncbi:MAG: hypothetical protein IJ091_05440, partial [Oscillospiraceae bacterium]|nr:hypothetical protein [Oscillospiraceae bacterium]
MEKKRQKRIDLAIFFMVVIVALIVAFALGLEAKTDISYTPYNGDWQHYNMFRRLLSGQTPFVDFPLVLG